MQVMPTQKTQHVNQDRIKDSYLFMTNSLMFPCNEICKNVRREGLQDATATNGEERNEKHFVKNNGNKT